MRTKTSKLPSAKPQIALLAMALVISSGAIYAQSHRGQANTGNPAQSVQSVTPTANSSFTQPAQSTSQATTLSRSTTRPQIAGGANGENEDD